MSIKASPIPLLMLLSELSYFPFPSLCCKGARAQTIIPDNNLLDRPDRPRVSYEIDTPVDRFLCSALDEHDSHFWHTQPMELPNRAMRHLLRNENIFSVATIYEMGNFRKWAGCRSFEYGISLVLRDTGPQTSIHSHKNVVHLVLRRLSCTKN